MRIEKILCICGKLYSKQHDYLLAFVAPLRSLTDNAIQYVH